MTIGLVVLAGCPRQGSPHDRDLVRTTDSAGITISTINTDPASLPRWSITPGPDYVIRPITESDSARLETIGPVRWEVDGDLVVTDVANSRFRVFDSTGIERRSLGRAGAGPCELRWIATVTTVEPNQLVVFDRSLRRVTWFDTDGGGCRTMILPGEANDESWPAEVWPSGGGRLVGLQLAITPQDSVTGGGRIRPWPMRARLSLRDSTGAAIAEGSWFAAMYTGLTSNGDVRLPFSNVPFVAVADGSVWYGSGQPFTVSVLDSAFRHHADLRWPAATEPITDRELLEWREASRASQPATMPRERIEASFRDMLAPEILPANRPAIGRVLVGPGGLLWVERFAPTLYRALTAPTSDRWTVLDRRGTPVARLELPESVRLEAIAGERVAIVATDSLGAQRVEVRRLLEPRQ